MANFRFLANFTFLTLTPIVAPDLPGLWFQAQTAISVYHISAEEGREPVEDNENLLDIAQLQVFYQIKQEDSVLKVT